MRRDPHAPSSTARGASVASRSASLRGPDDAAPAASRPELLLGVQRSAGNWVATEMIDVWSRRARPRAAVQRQPPGAAGGADAPTADDHEGLSPEVRRQLMFATTTLRRIGPLAAADQAGLDRAISGAPLYDALQQRDRKREELEARRHDLLVVRPIAGVPAPDSPEGRRIDELKGQITRLTAEATTLDNQVQSGLREAGCSTEAELTRLLTTDFPRQFIERGKQIAIAELDQNRELAEREQQRFGAGAEHATDRDGLRRAGVDLRDRQRELADLDSQLTRARSDTEPLPGGVRDPGAGGSSEYDVRRLTDRIAERTADFDRQRDVYRVQYPILMRIEDYETVATADDARLAQLASGPAQRIIGNIDATKDNVRSGQLKVWNLHDVVDMTVLDMGIGGNETLMRVVRQHIDSERSDEAMLRLAVGALALTAGIVATVATGGVALAAAGVALGAGTYQVAQSIQNYNAESAASNVALDPRVADISRNEPDLVWLVLDLAFVILDAAQLVRVFNEMRLVAQALRDTGDLGEFARVARQTLPRTAGDRVIASAARFARTLPGRTGGRAGIIDSLEWLAQTNPLNRRPFSQARLAEELNAVRQALLASSDLGAVAENLRRLGVSLDRSVLNSIKQYNFNSPGIGMSFANYSAWRRLASGRGQVRDAQYVVHEAAEIGELRRLRSQTGFDYMGRGLESASATERARWAADFDRAYLAAHRRALEAEYDFVAQQVAEFTNGRVRISRNLAAVADSRAEARQFMLVDGVALGQHSSFARLSAEAADTVEIGAGLQARLRLGPRPTVSDLVRAIRGAAGR